jgi:hypothetical protein
MPTEFERRQAQVRARMRGGKSLARIENEIIEPSSLDEEHKAALWLEAFVRLSRRAPGIAT